MIRRRTVLAGSLSVPLLAGPLLTVSPAAAGAAPDTGQRSESGAISVVVLDRSIAGESRPRLPEGFGGLREVRTFNGDVTPVYDWLDRSWRLTRFAVAGITTRDSLFLLERLAHDHGLRLVALSDGRGEQARNRDYWRPESGSGPVSWIIEPGTADVTAGPSHQFAGQG